MRSKLRHPIRAIREPFGTAGLIVACVALIAALGGSALAAKGALTAKQKKEVTKIAKKYAGKPGAPGATGPQGPQGNPGPAGANGTNGADGAPGANGKSVTVGTEAPGTNCANGGVNVVTEGSSTKRYVCNGGFGEEMEPGTTLRGNWSIMSPGTGSLGTGSDSVSYLMKYPGTTPPTVVFVRTGSAADCESAASGLIEPNKAFVEQLCEKDNEAAEDHCDGTFADPQADEGFVCFYLSPQWGEGPPFPAGAYFVYGEDPATPKPGESTFYGATLRLGGEAPRAAGTWAVTAPEEA